MKKATLLVIAAMLFLHTQISAQNAERYISDNLGRIVEVANSGGTLTTPHLLIGYDTTGIVYQSNSVNTYKIFGLFPDETSLQNLNSWNKFGSPSGDDSYEIRFGSDSSRYWINTNWYGTGGNLAPNQLPFSVYHVGPKSSADTSVTGGIKLCLKVTDQDADGIFTAGEMIYVFADLALPLDSTYDSLSQRTSNPFVQSRSVMTYLRFGAASVPYSQTTFSVPGDGFIPPYGTVIRFVAQTADSIEPVIQFPYTISAPRAGIVYRFPITAYSFEAIDYSLENQPENMTLSHDTLLWTVSANQFGHLYPFILRATNSAGHSYKTVQAFAGYQNSTNYVQLGENQIEYWTSNNGSIAFNFPIQERGLGWINDPAGLFYAAGMYLGGQKQGTAGNPDTISVSQVEFQGELDAGRILNNGPFGSLLVENPDTSAASVLILPDHSNAWPPEAPHDELGNPLKLSVRDTWTVFNDVWAKSRTDDPFSLSPGFGIECQRQTFQFPEYPFDQAVLVRLRMINKSDAAYDSCFFGLWADPDVGLNSVDDLCMVDSTLPCLITYSDPAGSDQSTSAAGILVIQSPVTAGNVNDTATVIEIGTQGFEPKRKTGKKYALPSSAYVYMGAQCEPDGYTGKRDISRYWYLMGLDNWGSWKPNGRFDLTNCVGTSPADLRVIMGIGPYTFLAGDTQEVWYSLMGAKGTTKANSVDSILSRAYLMKEKFYSDMNSVIVGVNDPVNPVPQSMKLHPNYPNPFNPSTTIRYQLAENSKVTLKIYNLLGQEVRTLVNAQKSSGMHSVIWDGKNHHGQRVTSGVYFYRLQAGDFVKTRKMVLVK